MNQTNNNHSQKFEQIKKRQHIDVRIYSQIDNKITNIQNKQEITEVISTNQRCVGYTFLFKKIYYIDNNFLLGLQKYQSNSCTVQSVLLECNGKPAKIQPNILNEIIKQINAINKSLPYCFISPKGHFIIKFKIQPACQNLVYLFFEQKILKTVKILLSLFHLYGITNTTKKNMTKDKIQALKICLNNKKKVVSLLRQSIKINPANKTSKQRYILRQQQQANQMIEQITTEQQRLTYCQYFDVKQIGQQTSINKTNKFIITQNNYKLSYQHNNHMNIYNGNVDFPKQQKQMKLVKKTINPQLPPQFIKKAEKKLQRQIMLIKNIKFGSQYFLKYYLPHQNCDINITQNPKLLMEHASTNLSFWISNQIFSTNDILNIFGEIVTGVKMLHKSGIVHRDIKPQNIMVCQQGNPKIRIIDFSDSALIAQPYTTQLANSLGSSLPYSPFQCAYNCDFGVNNPAIDIWSLGVIFYELIYKDTPNIYYKNPTMQEFAQGILKDQFTISIPRRWKNKSYFGYMEEFAHKIIENCIVFSHEQRFSINSIIKFIKLMNQMVQQMQQIVEGYIQLISNQKQEIYIK